MTRANVPANVLRVNVHALLTDCLERGLAMGYRRAHKHTDAPDEATLLDAQQQEIWIALDEFFVFDEVGQ